jgi:hypothetical protein
MRPIWSYPATTDSEALLASTFRERRCPCCGVGHALAERESRAESRERRNTRTVVAVGCDACGWWLAYEDMWDSSCGSLPNRAIHIVNATGAALQRFAAIPDASALTVLRGEIASHIGGTGPSRSWAMLEDVTKSVLQSMGYEARVTNRSKDGGIDVVFDHRSHGIVFVQVKHNRGKVGVGVLRELVGTMVVRGSEVALLVTSSAFTKGVEVERARAEKAGRRIELVDGQRFLSALNLVERRAPRH